MNIINITKYGSAILLGVILGYSWAWKVFA